MNYMRGLQNTSSDNMLVAESMVDDAELRNIREKRMQELQSQYSEQANAQVEAEIEAEAKARESEMIANALRTILTPEAKERVARLEMGHPELAETIKLHLVNLDNAKKIKTPVDDKSLKAILQQLQQGKRETKIRRI